MRIPIVPISNELHELAIIELQGEIIPKDNSFDNRTFGPLTVDADGRATLIIGNHELRGKTVTLTKPLLVLERGTTSQIGAVACIRRKVVFSERPQLVFA